MTRYELLAVVPDCPDPRMDHLRYVRFQDATAVLAGKPSPILRLPQSRKDRLRDAAKRQKLLEDMMPFGPVLSVVPDTTMSEQQAEQMLRANAPLLLRTFGQLAGEVQYQLTIRWDRAEVLTAFRQDAEIAPLFACGNPTSAELVSAITALSGRLTRNMQGLLDGVVTDLIALPCEEDMLLNIAVLVNTTRLDAFDHVVEQIDALWTDGLRISQIGPAPAASFATLMPRLVHLSERDAAFEHMRLSHDATDVDRTARYKALLRAAGEGDAFDIAKLKAANDIVAGAIRNGPHTELFLCETWQEGTSDAQSPISQVA